MSNQVIHRVQYVYEQLKQAEESKKSIAPLTELYPDLTIDEAYQVQLQMIGEKVQAGQKIVGKKIGLTSVAMQQLLGVDQPDYGHLLDTMEVSNQGTITLNDLFQPKVEGEIAFILNKDLTGPNVTVEDVLAATAYIAPALEIVDSRITDWKITLADTVADNASSGLFVIGDDRYALSDIDLRSIEMNLFKNGELVNTGYGSDVLGHPAECVAWLANKLSEYNVVLKAGEVILSGALSAAVVAEKGDRFTAGFSHIGKVEVSFK
ncbi:MULTISPECIES: 2-keto-4-pentenoate hydratase [Neobacillus]|uniref:Fumarylacetoacetate hydrolase family protein n=1 Tax=Neobacillus rhizophilus TaxID=2833579 RepID=A0A942U7M6_9BACI|nr:MULTISPECIES: 2-keto-4-pentenoate hydratase [Neobacillus]MBS4213896.1 fumarylacetoacetate hydrolase family protein [Neobacillus rhizophilus]